MRRLLAGLLLVLLAACTPLYMPPLIDGAEPEPRARLELELLAPDGRPQLHATVLEVAEPGWLAVQWFAPGGREVASQSVWLDEGTVGSGFVLDLPADVEAQPGVWRALLSQHSLVLRQLNVAVP